MKLKKKNKIRKEKQKEKIILEGSVQIKRLFNPKINQKIQSKINEYNYYSTYFTLYEFKTGLILDLIDFYSFVNIHGSAEAFNEYSNKFGVRKVKNISLCISQIIRSHGDLKTGDTKLFLDQISATIFYLTNNFLTDIKGQIGEFQHEEIINLKINNVDDYQIFATKYNEKKFLDQRNFWKKYNKELHQLILVGQEAYEKQNIENIHKYLSQIQNNLEKANTHNVSKGIGDAVITVDCPENYTILTHDHSFELLCPLINKKYLKLDDIIK